MNQSSFNELIDYGKIGEEIFKNEFLDFLQIKYTDVTNCQQFQIIDSDFITKIGLYEIKLNYKDDKVLIFEDYTNINESLNKLSLGWFYKTKADLIVFISKSTHTMVFLPFTENFKNHYEKIKEKYELIKNKISYGDNGGRWQSAFRKIPFSDLSGYISVYKKLVY